MHKERRPSSQLLPTNCVYYVEDSGSSFLERDVAVSVIVSLSSEWEVPSSFAVLGRRRRSLQLKAATTTLVLWCHSLHEEGDKHFWSLNKNVSSYILALMSL